MWLEALTKPQREALLRLAHNVIVSDGVLHPNEELLINEFRREMDLHPVKPVEYIDLDGLEVIFDSHRARTIAILNLIHISYVDGAFEIEEECMLRQLARQFDIDDGRFMLMDNWVRRMLALEQEARAFM
jgi:tellurite resistance protein